MIYFTKDSQTVQISNVNFDGLVPNDISLLLAYDHHSYRRYSNPIGTTLNGVVLNSKWISLQGKIGLTNYGGMNIKLAHIKPNASLSRVAQHFIDKPINLFNDAIKCSKISMGGYKR